MRRRRPGRDRGARPRLQGPRPRPVGLLGEVTSQRDGGGSFRQQKWDLGPEDPSPSAAGRGQAGSTGAGAAAAALGVSHPPLIEALGAAGRPESDGESGAVRGAEPDQTRSRGSSGAASPSADPGSSRAGSSEWRAAMELRVGNRYRLGRKIGSGSFGDIYLGEAGRAPGWGRRGPRSGPWSPGCRQRPLGKRGEGGSAGPGDGWSAVGRRAAAEEGRSAAGRQAWGGENPGGGATGPEDRGSGQGLRAPGRGRAWASGTGGGFLPRLRSPR